jgi:hypothetical protein
VIEGTGEKESMPVVATGMTEEVVETEGMVVADMAAAVTGEVVETGEDLPAVVVEGIADNLERVKRGSDYNKRH